MGHKTVYVTGAPASGKSSTTKLLADAMPQIGVWEYGAMLTAFLKDGGAQITDQRDLRARSADIATPADIQALDKRLLDWVTEHRAEQNLLIDSHPVTKEEYGFRITAFSTKQFESLHPDEIWLFYASPKVTVERIKRDSSGRPLITLEEARMHTMAQASVAAMYGITAGCPVYIFDTNVDQAKLVGRLRKRLG